MAFPKDPKQDLLPYMTFAVPDLTTISTKPGSSSTEERLQTIIANLDHHHQETRLKIIEAGKQNLAQALAEAQHTKPTTTTTNQESKDENTETKPSPTPQPTSSEDPNGLTLLLANLSAPYHESMGDPVSSGPAPPPPPGTAPIRQATPPLEIQHAKETLDKITLYDSIALPARKFYSDAWSRLPAPISNVGGDPRRHSSGGAFAKPNSRETDVNSRPGSSSRAISYSGAFGRPSPGDPRLTGRSRRGSWARQSPAQAPVERTTDPRLRRRGS